MKFKHPLFLLLATMMLLLTPLVVTTPSFAQDNSQDSKADTTAKTDAKSNESADEKEDESADSEIDDAEKVDTEKADDADKPAEKEKDWMDDVDKWFGDYLVTPMSTVLFFDFFTGPKVNNDADGDGEPDHSWNTAYNSARDAIGIPEGGWLTVGKTAEEGKPVQGTSVPFVVIWLLLGGIYFTVRMSFINIRGFWHAIRLTKGDYDKPGSEGDVSHFQALSAALSATVGLGNIAGVALAISKGGPGATFWMVVIGLIGMSSKFSECTLGQMYRKVGKDGKISGGPMIYLREGLKDRGMGGLGIFLAGFFSLLCIGGSIGGGNTFQVVQSLGAIKEDPAFSFLADYPWIYGLVMVVLVGLVIIGGIESIGKVAGRIVPFMCGVYVLFATYILATNIDGLQNAVSMIFSQAFNPQAVYGGFLGVMVIGITRAVFSNEAGTGSAAIAHSAAKTEEPVSEGIVALLEPFIDTVVVCTMTALVIIVTGAFEGADTQALRDAGNGAGLTAYAFQTGGAQWFKYVLYLAVFLFAFSTCISWSYYGERCFTHWFGQGSSIVYKILFLVFTFLGSIVSAANIQAFSDILILSMALPNVLGVLLLSGTVKDRLDEYSADLKSGKIAPYKGEK